MSREERAVGETRGYGLAMAGFSFTIIVILLFVDLTTKIDLAFTVYSLLVSFLLYYAAWQMQSYKFHAWQDLLSDAILANANYALMMALAALIYSAHAQPRWLLLALVASAWGIDYVIRVRLEWLLLGEGGGPSEAR